MIMTDTQQNSHVAAEEPTSTRPSDLVRDDLPDTNLVDWSTRPSVEDVTEALTDVIEDQTQAALDGLVSDFRINWVWMPPWGLEMITEEGRDQLRALGFNV